MRTIRPALPAPYFLLWFYALIPAIGGMVWLAIDNPDLRLMGMPIDILPVFQGLFIILAFITGLPRSGFVRAVRFDLAVLAILGAVLAWGLIRVAPEPMHGLAELFARVVVVVVAICMAYLCTAHGPDFAESAAMAVLLHVVLHLPVLVVIYVLFADEAAINWTRGPGGFWHVRVWAMFLAAAIAITLGFSLGVRPGPARWGVWAGLAMLWALLFWSGSRGSIAGLGAGYLLAVLIFPRQLVATLVPMLGAAVIGAGLSLLLVVPDATYGIFNGVAESVASENLDRASGGRLTLWGDALTLVAQRPWLGHGFDQFRFINFGEFHWTLQPHNEILNLAVQVGVVGTLCVLALALRYWGLMVRSVRQSGGRPDLLGAFIAINALIAISMVDGSLFHIETLTLAALLSGILLARPSRMDTAPQAQYIAPDQAAGVDRNAQNQR